MYFRFPHAMLDGIFYLTFFFFFFLVTPFLLSPSNCPSSDLYLVGDHNFVSSVIYSLFSLKKKTYLFLCWVFSRSDTLFSTVFFFWKILSGKVLFILEVCQELGVFRDLWSGIALLNNLSKEAVSRWDSTAACSLLPRLTLFAEWAGEWVRLAQNGATDLFSL